MDMLCFGQSELVDNRGEDFCDGEEFFVFRSEFGVGDRAFEISGFEPDFVSFSKRGEVSVGTGGHDLVGEFIRSESFVTSGSEGF